MIALGLRPIIPPPQSPSWSSPRAPRAASQPANRRPAVRLQAACTRRLSEVLVWHHLKTAQRRAKTPASRTSFSRLEYPQAEPGGGLATVRSTGTPTQAESPYDVTIDVFCGPSDGL
jgi:hypothetical protein